jgi:N12 class adenine-specific DNA methylase
MLADSGTGLNSKIKNNNNNNNHLFKRELKITSFQKGVNNKHVKIIFQISKVNDIIHVSALQLVYSIYEG